MDPVKFPEANALLLGLGGPNVEDLPVFKDGVHIVSCWELNAEEVREITESGRVWVGVWEPETHAMVAITTGNPFKTKKELIAEALDAVGVPQEIDAGGELPKPLTPQERIAHLAAELAASEAGRARGNQEREDIQRLLRQAHTERDRLREMLKQSAEFLKAQAVIFTGLQRAQENALALLDATTAARRERE